MTSGLLDTDRDRLVVVSVWKYRFAIGSGAWECPAFKGTADLIKSREGTSYGSTEQHVPLSRISSLGEYVPIEAAHAAGSPEVDAVERMEAAEIKADRQERKP